MDFNEFLANLDRLPRKQPRPFSLTPAERAELRTLSPAERELRLDVAIYAHMYREECRVRHVAILAHHVEMALQQRWQAEREGLIAEAETAVFSVEAA